MITSFRGQYRFLSNFWPAPVVYDGYTYESTEHAYQAAKTTDLVQRAKFHMCSTPGEAKRLGRSVGLRPDWEDIKINVMFELVLQKFASNQLLRKKLLATGDQVLIEGNSWGDKFWGQVLVDGEWQGTNWLGKILMNVRTMLGA